jgi:hypothetical protein
MLPLGALALWPGSLGRTTRRAEGVPLKAVLKLLTGNRCAPLLSGSRVGEHLIAR